MVNWLQQNYQWIFSGCGLFLFGFLFRLITRWIKKKTIARQSLISGNNSFNIQAGRDVSIVKGDIVDEQ